MLSASKQAFSEEKILPLQEEMYFWKDDRNGLKEADILIEKQDRTFCLFLYTYFYAKM
jgi:hypothetical protein